MNTKISVMPVGTKFTIPGEVYPPTPVTYTKLDHGMVREEWYSPILETNRERVIPQTQFEENENIVLL